MWRLEDLNYCGVFCGEAVIEYIVLDTDAATDEVKNVLKIVMVVSV